MNTPPLAGKVAVVTGGARGLGAAIAEQLALAGASVWCADRRHEQAGELCARLRAGGGDVRAVTLDVTDPEAWEWMVGECRAAHERIDVLVNNAAIMRVAALADEDPQSFGNVVEVALTGAMLGMRAVVPMMREQGGGAIVNITSTAAHGGVPAAAAYHAAKGALRALTRAVAVAYAGDGIRSNCLVPGSMRTPMVEEIPGLADAQAAAVAQTPLGRVLDPSEVARAVVFLASDAASYMVGADLIADGGFLAA